jgi:hypothetical protein
MIRQVMEGAGLTFWPVLSFLIFLTSCAFMLAWLYRPGSSSIYGSMSRMALEDGDGNAARAQEGR